MKHLVYALCWFVLAQLVTSCVLEHETTAPAPAPSSSCSSCSSTDAVVGSPCAINIVGDCEIQACWFPGKPPDMVSRRPLNDAGPDACEGIDWP